MSTPQKNFASCAVLVGAFALTGCELDAHERPAGASYGSFRRPGSFEITARTTMAPRAQNQCGIQYSDDEKVGSPPMWIAGIDSINFGSESDGSPTGMCGRVASTNINGTQMEFVIVDRIWENDSRNRNYNQLDVAKWVYEHGPLNRNNLQSSPVTLTDGIHTGLGCNGWVSGQPYCNR
jgi:hypothetical protein